MTPSRHRLSLTERRTTMSEQFLLEEMISEYLDHHRAYGRSPKTIAHYEDSFKLLRRFLTEHDIPVFTASLTTAIMRQFSSWLQTTPMLKTRRGRTERSVAGV